jgi:hypothetical protein
LVSFSVNILGGCLVNPKEKNILKTENPELPAMTTDNQPHNQSQIADTFQDIPKFFNESESEASQKNSHPENFVFLNDKVTLSDNIPHTFTFDQHSSVPFFSHLGFKLRLIWKHANQR